MPLTVSDTTPASKKARLKENLPEHSPESKEPQRLPGGNIKGANTRVLQALISYNGKKIDFTSVSQLRMKQASALHKKIGHQPSLFISDGRGGGTLAELIREWTPNDKVSFE